MRPSRHLSLPRTAFQFWHIIISRHHGDRPRPSSICQHTLYTLIFGFHVQVPKGQHTFLSTLSSDPEVTLGDVWLWILIHALLTASQEATLAVAAVDSDHLHQSPSNIRVHVWATSQFWILHLTSVIPRAPWRRAILESHSAIFTAYKQRHSRPCRGLSSSPSFSQHPSSRLGSVATLETQHH